MIIGRYHSNTTLPQGITIDLPESFQEVTFGIFAITNEDLFWLQKTVQKMLFFHVRFQLRKDFFQRSHLTNKQKQPIEKH